MKIRARFALFSIFLTAVIVLGTSYASLFFLKALVLKEIETGQISVAQNLRKVCEESLISRDPILAVNYIETLQRTVKGIAYAVFVNTQSGLVLGKNEAFLDTVGADKDVLARTPGGPKEILTAASGKRIINFTDDVVLQSKAGTVYLGFFEEKVEANVRESIQKITRIIVYVSSGAFLIGFLISLIFAIQFTKPINQLAQGAKAIGEGNLDTQINIDRKDEIGFLADEFNTMAVKLKELDRLKDDFVSSVSHELRSPLTAISGYAELLTMKPIDQLNPEKTKKALDIIVESTSRLTAFVNDILDVAKIKAGKMELHKTNFILNETAESIFSLFQPLFQKKNIVAAMDVPKDLPTVPADGEKIRQVIQNLLSNAFKFTPDGGSITLSAAAQDGPEPVIRVQVKDTGPGIPKEHQGLIFGKFQQVPGTKDVVKGPKGTGLGLAIVKGIVEAHGGKVGFESEPGKGTTFFFTLPTQGQTGDHIVEAKKLA
ncbi:MAG: hypothetical protein A3A86_00365 [Elusimicrobia bacterium RIFCSPLOWO2_01_FULL_60_11]|nr:MAG: hypothetical protein A3A86_00365 [Elusimicrobia bacterium RIFCSPLOWO2_01_FULL_60_11]